MKSKENNWVDEQTAAIAIEFTGLLYKTSNMVKTFRVTSQISCSLLFVRRKVNFAYNPKSFYHFFVLNHSNEKKKILVDPF